MDLKARAAAILLPLAGAGLVLTTLLPPVGAQQVPPPPAPVPPPAPSGLVTVNLKLGPADLESVREVVPDLLSPQGTHQVLDRLRIVRVTDRPENVEAIRKIIEALAAPAPNVRLVVVSRSVGSTGATGAFSGGSLTVPDHRGGARISPPVSTPGVIRQTTVNGRPVPGPVTGPGGRIVLPRGGVEIGGAAGQSASASLVSQSLLVRSGGTGILEVVSEVPMIDFFTRLNITSYLPLVIRGPGNQPVVHLIPGGTFEVPTFRWERAGAELMVKPVVQGNLITVEVIPRISAIVIRNGPAFRERSLNTHLTGADQFVEFTSLATTVTIADGATLTIGSFARAGADFNRSFWGHGAGSAATAGSITLKATIE